MDNIKTSVENSGFPNFLASDVLQKTVCSHILDAYELLPAPPNSDLSL